MKTTKLKRFSCHKFTGMDSLPFSAEMYSKLKYGSIDSAKIMGEELADSFFLKHSDIVMSKQLIVAESAYAQVRNAASLMTDAFSDKLNRLSISYGGHRVHRIKINRDIPYISDYGKLTSKARQKLLAVDNFTLDSDYIKDKYLLLLDDCFISGAHHKKLEEMLENYLFDFDKCMGLYYAELDKDSIHPKIEAELNTAFVKTINDLDNIGPCVIVVRNLKMILGWNSSKETNSYLQKQSKQFLEELYRQSLREGYYKVPSYSQNFAILQSLINL